MTTPALIVFAIGVVGLVASTAAMRHTLPDEWTSLAGRLQVWRAARATPAVARPARSASRRVITGASAIDRLSSPRPARHLPLAPDILRRERERLRSDESRQQIDDLVDNDPDLVVEIMNMWLAADDETGD